MEKRVLIAGEFHIVILPVSRQQAEVHHSEIAPVRRLARVLLQT